MLDVQEPPVTNFGGEDPAPTPNDILIVGSRSEAAHYPQFATWQIFTPEACCALEAGVEFTRAFYTASAVEHPRWMLFLHDLVEIAKGFNGTVSPYRVWPRA